MLASSTLLEGTFLNLARGIDEAHEAIGVAGKVITKHAVPDDLSSPLVETGETLLV